MFEWLGGADVPWFSSKLQKRDSVNDLSSHCPQGLIFCHGVVLWQLDDTNCRHVKGNWGPNELEKILSWLKKSMIVIYTHIKSAVRQY